MHAPFTGLPCCFVEVRVLGAERSCARLRRLRLFLCAAGDAVSGWEVKDTKLLPSDLQTNLQSEANLTLGVPRFNQSAVFQIILRRQVVINLN